jgi:hypothetical protein
MRIVLVAAIIASLAMPVLATSVLAQQAPGQEKTPEQVAKERADRAATEAYKKSLKSIPDQGPTDPWGGVRSNDGSKPDATKTAKSKAKPTESKTTESKTTETKTTATKP